MDQLQAISSKIVQIVSEAPSKTVPGVHVGAFLKTYFPSFRPAAFGSRNLRQFIKSHVPQVAEKNSQGPNVVYTLANASPLKENGKPPIAVTPSPRAAATPQRPPAIQTAPSCWRAFTNPSQAQVVAINRDLGILQTFPSGSVPSEPWVVVPKPNGQTHLDIANEFVSTLAEPTRDRLSVLLRNPKWFIGFTASAAKAGVGPQWSSFRRRKLIDRFNAGLQDLSISPDIIRAPEFRIAERVEPLQPPSFATQPERDDDDASFRALVQRVIAELPTSELRQMKLPVGVVFDAIKR